MLEQNANQYQAVRFVSRNLLGIKIPSHLHHVTKPRFRAWLQYTRRQTRVYKSRVLWTTVYLKLCPESPVSRFIFEQDNCITESFFVSSAVFLIVYFPRNTLVVIFIILDSNEWQCSQEWYVRGKRQGHPKPLTPQCFGSILTFDESALTLCIDK